MSFPAYESYKESGVEWLGRVPSHWTRVKLSRIVDPLRPITYGIVQAGPDVADGVPYIRPADMTEEKGVTDLARLMRTASEIAKQYSRSEVLEGDLICSIGPSFGKLMEVPRALSGANLTQGTARIAVAYGNLPRFVFWLLRSEQAYAQWEASIGGATFRALNLEPLAATQVVVPPPAEQRAIAAFLDRETAKIDALVEAQERLIALLKEKRQAVISHAVTKGLDPSAPMKDSGVEWLGPVPAHWEVRPLRHGIAFIESGTSVNAADTPAGEGEIGVLKTSCVYRGFFEPAENKVVVLEELDRVSCPVKAGTLIVSRMNTPDLVGSAGLVLDDQPDIYLPDRLWQVHLTGLSPAFTHFWTLSGSYRGQVKVAAGGTSASMQNLGQDQFRALMLAWPPAEEQEAIVRHLELELTRSDELERTAMNTITLLQERRAALISAAVTGKIDVRGLVQTAEAA